LTEKRHFNRANTTAAYSTRKTIAPEAVLDALDEIEFADFVPRVQAELKKFNEVQTGKRNEYRRKLKEKEGDKGDKADVTGDGEERAAKRVRREGAATANTTKAGAATSGANREAQRGKEGEIDQEADEQPEDESLTEEFDAEPEVAEADEGNTEEQDDEEEEENDEDDDDDDDLSGVEQDDVDIDDADLRERTVGRGRRGDDDGDDGNSSESEGGSETEGE
jgi:hypothetical protein